MDSFFSLFLLTTVLTLVQFLAALPWVAALDPKLIVSEWRKPRNLGIALGGVLVVGLIAAVVFTVNNDALTLRSLGRVYGATLQLQLAADLFVLVLGLLLLTWPKGGAVALSAFREGVRQPMFWFIVIGGQMLLFVSPIIPYFTFGEDLKVVKDLAYATTLLAALVFGVIAASSSISEEIEGRSAITVMSKPVSRREFLLGKFAGLFLAALVIVAVMSWGYNWVVLLKQYLDPPITRNVEPDPVWVTSTLIGLFGTAGEASEVTRGILLWTHSTAEMLPGVVLTSGHVMILLAIAVALATRLPMVVNLSLCLVVYFVGNLTPILKEVAQGKYALVEFMANLFDTLLPGLDMFDMATAVVRDAPLPAGPFALYTAYVALYALMYTAIALLLGLILFEDRDLA